MTTAAVHLHNSVIGAVTWNPDINLGVFEYDPGFLQSGIEISPLMMPLGPGRFSFPNLAPESFKGLPGLLADSLPDKFGNLLINQWLARQGRTPDSFDPVERLCYLGSRAMGALEFHPKIFPEAPPETLHVEALVQLANDALASRDQLHANLSEPPEALATILRVGTSAGGARAKAVVAWNPKTGEIRSGQVPLAPGFEPWLIKFDGVSENRDKELADPKGYGRIEYAYHLMARAAGITMTDCRLLEENGRAHFMTRRFDRTASGDKFHLQSLCAIAHFDFNQAGAYSYEQAFQVARRLRLPQPDLTELYRRALFNILARNQDDHTKNISFMMDRRGVWSLAPAYDLIHSYNPNGAWTHRHQMTFAGKRENFTTDNLLEVAKAADVKTRAAKTILTEVHEAVSRWPEFASAAAIPELWARQIHSEMRMDLHL
ncbi:type II toxin-antitoxin system HipA family toxin [Luteolibacter pohnpeiensis]|uniref:Type II toxin-antitoxin system HipA family toxin n=1 Tax=Luteolibacter pohnpeiensis TaxID=454153 RepID=A0A934VVC9_9BACT|nr:type II toxin-antitoxin system HipA family toxin [Luteolibacter pohnpeiensis]MBK1881663.1 type II toxin-antitoxin system HipA family toxin [Luteolibacter pohnpeiensis]